MHTIDQAINATQALSPLGIAIFPQWCCRVRNRASNCSACVDACPHGAILAYDNDILLDADTCTGCGACAAACPTQALACKIPPHGQLAQQIEGIAQDGKQIAFCCEKSDMSQSDDARLVQVGCLAQLDEALIAHAAACGIEALALVSGECELCPNGALGQQIDTLVSRSEELFDFWEIPAKLACKTLPAGNHAASNPSQRRLAFQDLASDAKEFALDAARQSLQASAEDEPATLASILGNSVGSLPKQIPDRTTMLLNDLYALEYRPNEEWGTRLFAQVSINEAACTKCGKCAFFCPTGALQFHGTPAKPAVMGIEAPATDAFHAFRACDCVNCGLCADLCEQHALTPGKVNAKDLFELEPQSPYLGN